nr:reverse transcriptase domain-containing protein [Tanacetum cinerariifolium]
TLRVNNEAITFNLDQTSRYSTNYNDMTVNRIDVIGMACKEYSQEVLDFSDVIASGNPTPYYDPIVSTYSLTLTPFGDSDLLLERSRIDPTLLNDFEMATEGNGNPPVPGLRTMEELCLPTLNGRGGPIAPIFKQRILDLRMT